MQSDVPGVLHELQPGAWPLSSADDAVRAVETAIEREAGRLDVVMLSGGEPTVHPQIRELIERLCELPITRILLNTNGVRLANEDALLEFIAGLRDRVEIYLQYDGQREATHETLRGLDLREIKARVVAKLSAARIFTTLVMTVVPRERRPNRRGPRHRLCHAVRRRRHVPAALCFGARAGGRSDGARDDDRRARAHRGPVVATAYAPAT